MVSCCKLGHSVQRQQEVSDKCILYILMIVLCMIHFLQPAIVLIFYSSIVRHLVISLATVALSMIGNPFAWVSKIKYNTTSNSGHLPSFLISCKVLYCCFLRKHGIYVYNSHIFPVHDSANRLPKPHPRCLFTWYPLPFPLVLLDAHSVICQATLAS